MKGFRNLIIIAAILFFIKPVFSQQTMDARRTGMAFANSADTHRLEQVGMNPATLALRDRFNFELNLLSLNLSASNNSFNKSIYDDYFTTGISLSQKDKDMLLHRIPDSGLQGNFSGSANVLSLYVPYFSISVGGTGSGYVRMPKEITEILLNGNDDLNRLYDFSNFSGNGWGGFQTLISGAYPFRLENNYFDFLAVGITGKYLGGMGYFEVTESTGHLRNAGFENPYMKIDGDISIKTALGGSGIGADLGLFAKNEKLAVSLTAFNLFGSINWNKETEMHSFSVFSDSLTVSADNFSDSLIVQDDTTYAIGGFKTRLPFALNLGAAYYVTDKFTVAAELEKGMSESMAGTKRFRLALGTEFTGIPLLPLRTGFSLGGRNGFSFAFGTGLNLRYWYLDVGLINHGGFFQGSSRGVSVAASSRLRF